MLGAAEQRGLGIGSRRCELGDSPVLGLGPRSGPEQVQRHPQQDGAEPGVEAAAALVLGQLRATRTEQQPLPGPLEHLGTQLVVQTEPSQRPRKQCPQPGVQLLEGGLVSLERRAGEVEIRRVDRDAVRLQRRNPPGDEAEEGIGVEWKVRVRVPRDLERIDRAGPRGRTSSQGVARPGTRSPLTSQSARPAGSLANRCSQRGRLRRRPTGRVSLPMRRGRMWVPPVRPRANPPS